MDKYINYINQNSLGELYYDKTFKEITTLKVGGKVKLLYYPNSTVNFVRFYKYYIKFKDVSIFIIGNGSNVLASDDDYDGIVISFKKIKGGEIHLFSYCESNKVPGYPSAFLMR